MAIPPLEIRLLGGFDLRVGDRRVMLESARVRSLLAFLALHPDTPQSRQRIAFLFWPNSNEKQARTNLRHVLHQFRSAFPDAERYLDIGPATISWRGDAPVRSDVAEMQRAMAHAEDGDDPAGLEWAAAASAGELLPGEYDAWILETRDRQAARLRRIQERLLDAREASGDLEAAVAVAQQILRRDPLAEEVHARLIRLHAARGDRAGALRAYHHCAATLERELGVAPGEATRRAYEAALDLVAAPTTTPIATEGTALVGREREWETVVGVWGLAKAVGARFLVVAGEPGVGKTRLAEELAGSCARDRSQVARARAYQAEERPAYAPVVAWLRSDPVRPALAGLQRPHRTELARLLPELLAADPSLTPPESLPDAERRLQLHEAIVRALLAVDRPLLLILDDAQWCDAESLALVHALVRRAPPGLLVAATVRREEVDADHALEGVLVGLTAMERCDVLDLERLDRAGSAELARQVGGAALSEDAVDRLFRDTEGNPLFVIETLRTSGGPGGGVEERAPALSPKLRGVIASRLRQLSLPAREVLALAATIGREFTLEVLGAADEHDDVTRLRALDELWRRRIVREHGAAAYDFSHDKLREVAYENIAPPRRQAYHQRVARALEAVHGKGVAAVASRVARHYDAGGAASAAVRWYRWAADDARRLVAHDEAIRHLTRALALAETLPETRVRDEEELALRMALGPSLGTARGWATAEAGATYARARVLCRRTGDPRLFQSLWGLYSYHLVRGAELGVARTLGEEMVGLAEAGGDAVELVGGHFALGCTLAQMGEFSSAKTHLATARSHYDLRLRQSLLVYAGSDLGVFIESLLSHTLWHLNSPEEALERSRAADRLGRDAGHRFSQAIAAAYAATLHQFRDDPDAAEERATAAIALSADHGFPYYRAWGGIILGWAVSRRGRPADGLARMREGLAALRVTGAGLRVPFYLGLLAEACAGAGREEEALDLVGEALALAQRTGERWRDAELERLQVRLRDPVKRSRNAPLAIMVPRHIPDE